MKTHSGVAATLFQALADVGINIDLISTSEIKISVVVDLERADEAVARRARRVRPRQGVGAPAGHALRLDTRREPLRSGSRTPWRRGWRPTAGSSCRRSSRTSRPELEGLGALAYPELCFRFLRRFATDIPEAELAGARRALLRGASSGPRSRRSLELDAGPARARALPRADARLQGHRPPAAGQPLREAVRDAGRGDQRPRRHLGRHGRRRDRRPHGAARASRSSSCTPTGGSRRCRSGRWPARGPPTSTPSPSTGSFDAAQAVLKEIFGDRAFRERHRLAAVNSINIARVLAQCVYYLYAWLRLPSGAAGERRVRRAHGQLRQRPRGLDAPAGWGCPSRASGSRRTRTTSCTGSSRRASTRSARSGRASPPRWTYRSPPTSSGSSTTARGATRAG